MIYRNISSAPGIDSGISQLGLRLKPETQL